MSVMCTSLARTEEPVLILSVAITANVLLIIKERTAMKVSETRNFYTKLRAYHLDQRTVCLACNI